MRLSTLAIRSRMGACVSISSMYIDVPTYHYVLVYFAINKTLTVSFNKKSQNTRNENNSGIVSPRTKRGNYKYFVKTLHHNHRTHNFHLFQMYTRKHNMNFTFPKIVWKYANCYAPKFTQVHSVPFGHTHSFTDLFTYTLIITNRCICEVYFYSKTLPTAH